VSENVCVQVLFRKGGIREPTFRPASDRFLLFPTAFHSETALVREPWVGRYSEVRPPLPPTMSRSMHPLAAAARRDPAVQLGPCAGLE
jgi:hypothetical protein